MVKVKKRSYPSFGGLLHADPFHVEDVVADQVTTYCVKEKRFEEGMGKRRYRKPSVTYHPSKAKLLFKEPIYVKEFNDRVGAYCAASCGDWYVILDPASNCECFLWNQISRQKIQLPQLRIKFKNFSKCILTAPPTERHSQVWFFDRNRPTLVCCMIGYKKWRRWVYGTSRADVFSDVVSCNRNIYAIRSDRKQLYEIDSRPEAFYLITDNAYQEVEFELPGKHHLVDSCGELYLVQMFSVYKLEVFRMDFSSRYWVKVQNLGGRAFFISSNHSVSLDAEEFGMEKNCIYCTDDNLERLYVINLGDNSVSTSQHRPNSGAVWLSHEGQMPVLRVADTRDNIQSEEEVKDKEVGVDNDGENGTHFKLLPLKLVEKIGRCVGVGRGDYTNFRLVCRRWRLAAPPCHWDHGSESSVYPWFILLSQSADTFRFYDPGENVTYHKKKYTGRNIDCVAHFIKDGWVVYSQGEMSMFLWNLFTENRIELPDLPSENLSGGVCFSGSPGSPDFVVVSIAQLDPKVSVITYLLPDRSYWCFDSQEFVLSRNSNPVFLNGRFYFLGRDRNVGMLSLEGDYLSWWDLENTNKLLPFPSAACRQFLVSVSKYPLMAVFFCNSGEQPRVGVYKYNGIRRKWVEAKNLKGGSLFVSAKATLFVEAEQTVATMKNKIFFPRFSKNDSNKILPYSMETCRFQNNEDGHDMENNFCEIEDKFDGAWFQHKLVPTFAPRM